MLQGPSAIEMRAGYLMEKLRAAQGRVNGLEKENEGVKVSLLMTRSLGSGKRVGRGGRRGRRGDES